MAAKENNNTSELGGLEASDGNVDQIRQILFGGQMRDYEKRFADLETRLAKSIEQLAGTVEKRIERLDAYTRREVEKLNDKVTTERKARVDEIKQTGKQIESLSVSSDASFGRLEDQLDVEARELRSAIKEQGDELMASLAETREQLAGSLQQEAAGLADAKLGREDLAALLSEVALRLTKDFKLPKS